MMIITIVRIENLHHLQRSSFGKAIRWRLDIEVERSGIQERSIEITTTERMMSTMTTARRSLECARI
jgi:hypothetical protein